MTRITSGEDGSVSIGAPAAAVANRPRVKASASSSGSEAAKSAVRAFVASKREGTLRVAELVQIESVGAAAGTPVRAIETVRAARLHRTDSRGVAVESAKLASLPPAVAR